MEGKGFRDRIREFDSKNTVVYGVSFDTVDENRAFAEKFSFPFLLLCDTDRTIGLAYGAADAPDAGYAKRISYLIGPDGTIERVYESVDVNAHPAQVLADIG
ncbi:MAG: peroxiredoxin [Deltaproteobacteria bacterium]|nr:MAG: peroxiredoxin [Deltaproteobacteria bacterium]